MCVRDDGLVLMDMGGYILYVRIVLQADLNTQVWIKNFIISHLNYQSLYYKLFVQ